MLWFLIILTFIFIIFISLFGDYENEKIRREEKEIEEFLKERRKDARDEINNTTTK